MNPEKNPSGKKRGCSLSKPVDIPAYKKLIYYAPGQKYDRINNKEDRWPDSTNRFQPLVMESINEIERKGIMAVFELKQGNYLSMVAVPGPSTIAWFSREENHELLINASNLGTGEVETEVPLFAWGKSDDIYMSMHLAWKEIIEDTKFGNHLKWRGAKEYPGIFTRLGWCTWEEYRQDISERIIIQSVRQLEKSELPVRYILIDDGHLDVKENKFVSTVPDKEKFPENWENIMRMKQSTKIKWIGLWLNFNGYWDGISECNKLNIDSSLDSYDCCKLNSTGPMKTLLPASGYENSAVFYEKMIGDAAAYGFDFVKVDNQARNLDMYINSEQAVQSSKNNSVAMEKTVRDAMGCLINCMAHNAVCICNTGDGNVTRCSEDYLAGNLIRVKSHIHNSYANIPLFGHTVWGDHDMFHSGDPCGGRLLAVSKAMSGGPVLISDAIENIVSEIVMPLCLSNGDIPRPEAPASPLPESLMINPAEAENAFRVAAPLANGAVAVAVYNLTEPEKLVKAHISSQDYIDSGMMIQPVPVKKTLPAGGILVFDWYEQEAFVLDSTHRFMMEKFSDKLFIMLPVINGWAVPGNPDKYLSPAVCDIIESSESSIKLRIHEAERFLIWNRSGKIACSDPDVTLNRKKDGCFEVRFKQRKTDFIITFSLT